MKKIYFVVRLIRYDDPEAHSYNIGIYDNEVLALTEAWEYMKVRAGKYGAEVIGYELNYGTQVYKRTLSCWDAFDESCKELAKEVKKRLDIKD